MLGATPNAVKAFHLRPVSSGSGIGGMFGQQEGDDLNTTLQANAGSPIKREKGNISKWISDTGMKKPSDFHPEATRQDAVNITLQPKIMEIMENGSDSEGEDSGEKKRERFELCDRTQE
jgi:hypothetical protein